jgi:hypothetical protein
MTSKSNAVSVLELRRLIYELKDRSPGTCLRVRTIGEMWQPNFFKVLELTQTGVILIDCTTSQPFLIRDLHNVIQFEFDQRYQHYEPHFHYSVNVMQHELSADSNVNEYT